MEEKLNLILKALLLMLQLKYGSGPHVEELAKRGMKGSELDQAVSNQIIKEFGMMP